MSLRHPTLVRSYPLEDLVEATRYLKIGQMTGNAVLTINGGRHRALIVRTIDT
jgi:hypothetical protein